MRAKRKKAHPLKMPLRLTNEGTPICRFHNYDNEKGCMKGVERCGLDHSHCHICLIEGHKALNCPYYRDEALWKKFCATYTLMNTRPPEYQEKTVLGDVIVWDTSGLPLECRGDEGQLRRCRKHKRFEAGLLSRLAPGSSFCDVGAHFGDTTLTMAVHAKSIGRGDIRFFAFEPSSLKCRWIEKVAEANGVNVSVVNCAIGETERSVVAERGAKRKAIYDGSMIYEEVEDGKGGGGDHSSESVGSDDDCEDKFRMIALDSMIDEISPLGLLHLDVEGWEAKALKGASQVLRRSSEPCFVIAEVWEEKDCARRGVEGGMEDKITDVMGVFEGFKRGEDIKDQERNVVWERGT
ncbi:hypothetical protein TrRE_jg10306 [Triparma retinervis]|uniref:C3H1-type domain-containing protein n=1 Tax=Triparma retinervis TaxID=2557542 RepID=A0A9W7A526_9STRA|nr:hypothetical protein TrRE_jg10306 [Triparma retinervis]